MEKVAFLHGCFPRFLIVKMVPNHAMHLIFLPTFEGFELIGIG